MQVLTGAAGWTHDTSSTGTAVLVCHGFTGTPQSIRPVAEDLRDAGHAVSVPRLPGHGTTWRALSRTTWQDWYATVEAAALTLRRSAPDRPIVLVGLSAGGALVTRLAQQHPDLARGLVLVNPAFVFDDPRLRALPVLRHLVASIPGIGGEIRLPGAEPELAYDRTPVRALASLIGALPAVVADLPGLQVPTLLFRSAHDTVVPRVSGTVFLDRVGSRDVREVWLPDSGHVATHDHDAGTVLAATRAFVQEVAA